MDSYSPLLEKIRVPQPSLQKFAVISIFEKLREAPPHLDANSDPGREAIKQCLSSRTSAVFDQSVRELCRLVVDFKLDLARGLIELQSAIEGTDSRFVGLSVKALGFLVGLGFRRNSSSFRYEYQSSQAHPFVKAISSRGDVQSELLYQVYRFMVQNKHVGMVEVCQFLRPFLNFSIIRIPHIGYLSSFVRNLISSMISFCCSFPLEAMPIFRLLMGCLAYFPCKDMEEFTNLSYHVECMMDTYAVVLRQLVGMGLLVQEAQICGVELLEMIISVYANLHEYFGASVAIFEKSRHLLTVMRELGLHYSHEFSSVVLSLFLPFVRSELEHEQQSILKLFHFLQRWRSEDENGDSNTENELAGELFIFSVISLVAYPSKSVKRAAINLLPMLKKLSLSTLVSQKKEPSKQYRLASVSRLEHIIFRLLKHFLFQDQNISSRSFYLNLLQSGGNNAEDMHSIPKTWTSQLREFSVQIVGKKKSSHPTSQSQDFFLSEMPMTFAAIASVLVMHPTSGSSAVDLLVSSGNMDCKLGIPLLLLILYYNNVFSGKNKPLNFHDMLLKLLELLPPLGLHPAMTPIIVQTILPMFQKDAENVLYATAVRLLCKTWEINERTFGSLHEVLHPKRFAQFASDRNTCISMAVSVRDVCRRNPDRGVDLILSVSVCIESQDPTVQAIGFQSLAHLCEADVIDFYTAWDVVANHTENHTSNPIVAHSICLFLRWGALDAAAYTEAATKVLQLLWKVASSRRSDHVSLWAKARISAFEALANYEVPLVQNGIPYFREKNVELLLSENDFEVLRSMEAFEVNIITSEHINRRRYVKEKRVSGSKMEKLLDVFPKVIFASGNGNRAREFPCAALLCLSFTPKDVNKHGFSKGLEAIHESYGNALVEIASSLNLSRNIVITLLAVQSWQPFMERWMRACITFLDTKDSSSASDKACKATADILKTIMRCIEEACIPRSGENLVLAMGAFCMILPKSAHSIKSTASEFLLKWLFQYEHEYRQSSAAMSLGLVSSCLHVTDHKQKLENIGALLKVVYCSKNTFVKGACGVGLGVACQDFFTRVKVEDNINMGREADETQEAVLLRKIINALCRMISPLTHSPPELQSLLQYFPPQRDDIELLNDACYELDEEDIWGLTGLVIGLGSSVSALYRYGAQDAVLKIKSMITSWVPCLNPLISKSSLSGRCKLLSVGACLALPTVISFCQRVELIGDSECDHLVNGYMELIAELTSVKDTSIFHGSLLMASCVGVGNLVACTLNEGFHSMEVEQVKNLLLLFRNAYSNPHYPCVHLGGMLGVVNALGAGAGTLVRFDSSASFHIPCGHKESAYIVAPLLSSPALESDLTSLIQEIFLAAQNPDDSRLQQYATWAVSFLRHYMWSKEVQTKENISQGDAIASKSLTQNFPEDNIVMKLSLWLNHLNHPKTGTIYHVNSILIALRCLSRAPRLPTFDWGAIIRRCMKYEGQVSEYMQPGSVLKNGSLRKECLLFSFGHAKEFDQLVIFLNELYDLSRFKTLELSLQSYMLLHLAELIKIFSASRLEKLFDDVASFISWLLSSNLIYNAEQKNLLRVSCWKGLYLCLDEDSIGSELYLSKMEGCMEYLFSGLPCLPSAEMPTLYMGCPAEEWSAAVRCLGKARQEWLMKLLQVSEADFLNGDDQFIEIQKRIQARARLVQIGSMSLSELGKLKAYILNTRSQVIWDILLEFVATLQHAEGNTKRHWVVNVMEISCVTSYPSTALLFLGLLCGCWSKYMPLLLVDHLTVLSDLPLTLTSLLAEDSWHTVVDSVISYLWTSMERIYLWATQIAFDNDSPIAHDIDKSENDMAVLLLQVMHQTCVSLKDYLSPEKQLMLANMMVP